MHRGDTSTQSRPVASRGVVYLVACCCASDFYCVAAVISLRRVLVEEVFSGSRMVGSGELRRAMDSSER
jgi:hypothetical protein